MVLSMQQVRPARARWELHAVILKEEERRIVNAIEASAQGGTGLPGQAFERLKAARAQCDASFRALLAAIERGAARSAASKGKPPAA